MIRVITGPPCGGKSTYVKEHAKAGDLIVDFDDLVEAFGGKRYEADGLIREAAVEARKSAIKAACGSESTAWIIDTVHSDPFEEDEEVIVIDPGFDACIERAKADGRPQSTFQGIEKWYSGRKGRTMNHLYKSFDIKADEGAGTISGYFSTYDPIPDSYGDIVAPGAFTETIKAREETGHPFPLCWNHDLDQIIGKVDSIEDTEKGPLMTASFFDTPLAQEKRAIVQSGVVYQFSFAYDIEEAGPVKLEDGTKVNELRKLNLYEVSVVPIPANQNAVVTDVKAEDMLTASTASMDTTWTTVSTGTSTSAGSYTIPATVIHEYIVRGMEVEEKAESEETVEEFIGEEEKVAETEEKSGRRNSKSDAEKLEQAVTLIQDVLGQLDDTEEAPEDGEDEVKANAAAEEPEQSNPRKDALLEVIAKIKTEEE